MLFVSILLLIFVSINCENSVIIATTDQLKWCPLIQTNGTINELGICHRFRDSLINAEYVMFNRAGAEWLFNVTYNKTNDKYGINLLYNTTKYKVEGFVHRYGLFSYEPKSDRRLGTQRQNCYVSRKVNIIRFSFDF